MRIALLGSDGQLGRDLQSSLTEHDLLPLTRRDFDVADHSRARDVLTGIKPEIIVNTAAYHRVDDCEREADLAFRINAISVLNLSRIANDLDAALVHISTDYVFDGRRRTPYTEESMPSPLSVYGHSKLAGECFVRTVARRHVVIRTSGLYGSAGSRGKGGNFVTLMLSKAAKGESIRVVDDQVLTPTSTRDLARQMAVLLRAGCYGLFHITNEGSCSWHQFAAAIFEIAGVKADLSPTTSELYKTPAKRPAYSVLENARLKELGLNRMLHWREALTEYLRG